jgi:hypothetical protein
VRPLAREPVLLFCGEEVFRRKLTFDRSSLTRWRQRMGRRGSWRPEPLLEKAPVDRPVELGERVIDVDDLVEPRSEEIVLPAVQPLPGPHRITLRQAYGETESRPNAPINLQEIKLTGTTFLQMR